MSSFETGDAIKRSVLRGLAFFLRWPFVRGRVTVFELVYRLLNPKNTIVELQFNGLPVTIDLRELESRYLYYGAYELCELRFIKKHVKAGGTVVDVGANVGYLAAALARAVGPTGKVYAFEPNPVSFSSLQKLAAKSRGVIEVFQLAVADQHAGNTIRFYVSKDHPMWSSTMYGYSESEAIEVGTTSLSDFFARNKLKVDFIKIDVEGGEAAVLRGLSQYLLNGGRPSMLCEIAVVESGVQAETLQELNRLVGEFAYQIFIFDKNGSTKETSLDEIRMQSRTFNVVLLPPEAPARPRSSAELV